MIDFGKYVGKPLPPPPRVPDLVLGVTGHRPHKLYSRGAAPADGVVPVGDGYNWGNPLRCALREELRRVTETVVGDYARRVVPDDPLRGRDRSTAALLDSYLRNASWRPDMLAEDADGVAEWRKLPVLGVHGGALGVDQDAAGVWHRTGVPYLVAIPFAGQQDRWPPKSRDTYAKVLAGAAGTVTCSIRSAAGADYAWVAAAMEVRNHWIVAVADELISAWDGSSGGTRNCTLAFQRSGRRAFRIDPRDLRDRLK